MGIGVQGEACGEVAQHAGHGLDIHTILERDGSEGMAEIMESDFRDAGPLQHSLQHIVNAVWGDRTAVGGWEDVWIFQFFCLGFLLFQNFYCLG